MHLKIIQTISDYLQDEYYTCPLIFLQM